MKKPNINQGEDCKDCKDVRNNPSPHRDYTDMCSKHFAKAFVNSIFGNQTEDK